MKNKNILLLSVILTIAIVGIVVYFISRPPQQELLPQTFAQLPEKPMIIDEFHQNDRITYSVAFSPVDNSLIAFADQYGTINLWNRNNTKKSVKNLIHVGMFPFIGFSPTGELLAIESQGILVLWDVASRTKINSIEPSSRKFAFSPHGQLTTVYNEVKLWDIRNPKKITHIATLPFDEKHKIRSWACAVAISKDGTLIAAGYANGSVNVWNLQTKQHVKTLRTPFIEMRYLKFSPDNRFLVCGGAVPERYISFDKGRHSGIGVVGHGAQGYIMWTIPSWNRHGEVQRGHVEDLVFSPDGKICASMNRKPYSERGVEIWSVESGAPITALPMTSIPQNLAFSPDGKLLVVGDFGGGIQVWKHNSQQLETATSSADVVRIIYTLPKDKKPSPNITQKLDKAIRDVQDFYADEMERHGFGRKTFTFETDENGKAKIYLANHNHANIDLSNDIWLSFIEEPLKPLMPISKSYYVHHIHSFEYTNKEGISTKDNVTAREIEGISPGRHVYTSVKNHNRKSIAYLLRGTFGLSYVDYKEKPNILKRLFASSKEKMSWGKRWAKLSKCEAELLDRSRFFNPNQPFFDKFPTMDMRVATPKASGLRHFVFEVADEDGMHQVQLFVPRDVKDHRRGEKFYDCQALDSKAKATVVFEISDPEIMNVRLKMIDMHGNIASREFRIIEKTSEQDKEP